MDITERNHTIGLLIDIATIVNKCGPVGYIHAADKLTKEQRDQLEQIVMTLKK